MNLEAYTHGFLQNFLSLYKKVVSGKVSFSDIENQIKEAQKPKPAKKKPKQKNPIQSPKTPKGKSDIFNILPVPALSKCCNEEIYLIPPTTEQRKNGVRLTFLCGDCGKEFEVK